MTTETALSSFCVGQPLLEQGLPWSVVNKPARLHWKNQFFLCQWASLQIASWLRVEVSPLPLSALGPSLAWTCEGPVPAATVSVRWKVYQSRGLEDTASLAPPSSLAPTISFYLLFQIDRWALRSLMKMYHLGLRALKSHSLHLVQPGGRSGLISMS